MLETSSGWVLFLFVSYVDVLYLKWRNRYLHYYKFQVFFFFRMFLNHWLAMRVRRVNCIGWFYFFSSTFFPIFVFWSSITLYLFTSVFRFMFFVVNNINYYVDMMAEEKRRNEIWITLKGNFFEHSFSMRVWWNLNIT